jgi:drug/metabolite transporter (DMT)-like permease
LIDLIKHIGGEVAFAWVRRHCAGMSSAESAAVEPRRGAHREEEQAPLRPFLFLALAVFLWSGNWVVGRALHDTMPPIALNFWRWAGAALILAPLVLPRLFGRWHRVVRHWRILALLGGLGAALFQTMVYFGLAMTTTVNAVLMNSSMPLFIILCAWLIDRERATARQIAGIFVSLLGILVIMRRGDFGHLLQLEVNWGDLVILAAMPVWGVYSVLLRRRPTEFSGNELLFLLALFALVWLTPLVIIEAVFVRSGTLTLGTVGAVAYVALFASVIGYVCWNKGVAAVGANRAGVTVHLLPAFGTILAILFLGEEFHLFHLVGIATILAGVWLAASGRSP